MRINEDYYDSVDIKDITPDVDIIDDVQLAVDHILAGTYNPDWDVDLNVVHFTAPLYKPNKRQLIPTIRLAIA